MAEGVSGFVSSRDRASSGTLRWCRKFPARLPQTFQHKPAGSTNGQASSSDQAAVQALDRVPGQRAPARVSRIATRTQSSRILSWPPWLEEKPSRRTGQVPLPRRDGDHADRSRGGAGADWQAAGPAGRRHLQGCGAPWIADEAKAGCHGSKRPHWRDTGASIGRICHQRFIDMGCQLNRLAWSNFDQGDRGKWRKRTLVMC